MFIFSDKKNPEFIRENFVIRVPFCKDPSEKLISEPHFLKVQTFIPTVKNVPGLWQTGKPFKTRFQKKKKNRKNRAFFLKIFRKRLYGFVSNFDCTFTITFSSERRSGFLIWLKLSFLLTIYCQFFFKIKIFFKCAPFF